MSRIFKTVIYLLLTLAGLWSGNAVSAQCPMVCRQNFTVSLGADGQAVLDPEIVLDSSTDGCTQGFTIEILDAYNENNYGSVANAALIGLDLIFKVTDNATGNNCEGNLVVLDNTPPQIFLDTFFVDCNVNLDPEYIGFPSATDNVSPYYFLTFDWFDELTDLPCFTFENGIQVTAKLTRTWYVSDQYGNIRQEDQVIFLKRNTLDDITWPPNRDGISAPYLACNLDNPSDLTLTGEPSINGSVIHGGSDCDLLTSFTDQTTTVCGGETKIFRTWTVFDYCTDESQNYIQLIRVKDTEAPVLTCPAGIEAGTDAGLCTGTIEVPFATADDNCSGYTINHSWEFGENESQYQNIPAGGYFITYTARDECGNESSCQTPVIISDDEEPIPVCKEHTFISLSNSGTDFLGAYTFNESSTDNCQIDRFEVSRDGVNFTPGLTFDCADIPASPLTVVLRVFDTAGFTNDCEVEVTIDDFLSPVITCPQDITLDCFADFTDLNISGLATAEDNCGIENIFRFDDETGLNSCGFGTVLRLYTAEDASGNSAVCIQQINIGDTTPTGVSFPQDFITDDCSLKLIPELTGTPGLTGVDCEQFLVFHTDDTITNSDACLHIERFWEVYDECVFDPNNTDEAGYWSYFQTLKIFDDTAPELTIPADITMLITGENCEVYVEFSDATAFDCSPEVSVTNNSFFSDNNGSNASGFYPQGFHYITYTASDECGNITNQSVQLTVLDAEIPTVYCNDGLTVNLSTSGTAEINPQLFDAGSYDNCSENLTYHLFPSNVFDCDDRGEKEVLFQVRDESGNEASCWTSIIIQDNNNVCPKADIAGTLSTAEGESVSGKYVGLSGAIQMAVSTNADGTFEFPNLPSGEYYELTPTYNQNIVNGVTTNDIIFIRKHILNTQPFTSPYTLVAADVNNSGSVTTTDIVWLRRAILNDIEEFPNNESWRFIDAAYEFISPEDPFNEGFPEEIIIPVLNQNYTDNNFIAIKVGDVNGSANFGNNSGEEREEEERERLEIYAEDVQFETYYEYNIPLKVKDFKLIQGLQFEIEFSAEALQFNRVEAGEIPEINEKNFGFSHTNEGLLSFSWDYYLDYTLPEETVLFTLNFTAKKDALLSEVLQLREERIQAEAYRGTFRNDDLKSLDINLSFLKKSSRRAALHDNYPNPTTGKTTIGFYLGQSDEVTLTVTDVYGKRLWTQTENYGKGEHQIHLDLTTRKLKPGVYFYQLSGSTFRNLSKKMLIAR